MLIILPLLALLQGFSLSNEAETKLTGKLGDTVTLPCVSTLHFPVDWRKQTATSDDYICIGGVIVPDLVPRFQLTKHIPGVYNLTISDVEFNDSGRYRCIENSGIGDEHLVVLIVEQRGDDDDKSIIAYVEQTIQLPCRPTVESPVDWKKFNPSTGNDDYICMGGAIVKELTWKFQLVGYNLTIKEVTASDDGAYRCIEKSGIGTEHIVRLNVNTTRVDRNIATSTETSTKINQTTTVVLILVLVAVVVVAFAVGTILGLQLWRRHLKASPERKGPTQDDDNADQVLLRPKTRETRELTNSGKSEEISPEADIKPIIYRLTTTVTITRPICGFTVIDDRIYVCVRESDTLHVFDNNGDASSETEIAIPNLKKPADIVHCSKCRYMYITDRSSSTVWKFKVEGNQVKDQSQTGFEVRGIKSTPDKPGPDRLSIRFCRLLVTFAEELVLFDNVCTGATTPSLCIPFPNMNVHHAIETEHETFIVAHWDPIPRVIETDRHGAELNKADVPAPELVAHYMDIDSSGRVFCANMTQDCIVLLYTDLGQKVHRKVTCIQEQIKAESNVLVNRPNRVHFVDDRLLVSGYSGDIQIFQPLIRTSTDADRTNHHFE